ncbi:ATP-binding cassette-type vacuolar membrane transporter-like protein Hmt1 [Byssothecium circinans]|uniref:ATP-binding cassette-type vacuolar membrane transporter-like protein Hmt1 n=1 Tax=Byssothecium circinans TaxID=147558 RepID=A0A6A5TK23_9PLEO|nr:ATP-binding cassette-type vacuolar membrane transporter-like protein Hmt1 [Byssothecium circinans]
MVQPPGSAAQYPIMALLDYMQAPFVGFYYLGASAFALCVLQKAKPISLKRRRLTIFLSLVVLVSYITEVLYYFGRSLADARYTAPQHAAIRCLGSILIWIPFCSSLIRTKDFIWHPYFGAFVSHFVFETVICLLRGFSLSQGDRWSNIPLSLSAARSSASLLLILDGFLILIQKKGEKGTDEEEQSLLGPQADSSATQNGNAANGYGAIEQAKTDEDEETNTNEDDIKKQQAKRLQEQGGWYGYLKGFTIFVPYLWPKDDWVTMTCLFLRLLYVIQGRALNLLEPRQLGIITNKLHLGATEMPWKDIGLWTLYRWINGYAGFGIVDSLADTIINNRAFERITILAYRHLMSLSMDFHSAKDSGEVLKAVEQASSLNSLIELVFFEVCPILIDLVIAMYYVTVLFDAYMAFLILFMGLAYIWIGFIFTSMSQPRRRTYVEKQRTENTTVNETVHNWQTVAYFNRPDYERERYRTNIRSTIMAYYQYYFRSTGGRAAQDVLMTFGFTACCVLAISKIITGEKPVGNLITFIMYWGTMMSPLYMMSYSYRQLSSSLIDAERLLQLLNTKPSVVDKENAQDLVVKEGKVEFRGIDFSYDERKQIIKNVSFVAQGNSTVAFCGETGGGKSTMLKLLFRFYDVTNGSILIDGQDLRSVTLSSLRDALGLVPQDPALFNQTIRQNVRYAKLDATDAEIEDACRAAAIHDDIMSFPEGYASKVGERGVRLSGGQLQRIAIARVLLKDPKIVMLDEATSAIDSAIEAQIQEAFKKLSKGRTTFVIAHRLSTIVDADQILVVDKGSIIERGTHGELLELGGKYCELWTKQTAGSHTPDKMGSKAPSAKDEPLIDITPADEEGTGAKASGVSKGDDEGGVERRK